MAYKMYNHQQTALVIDTLKEALEVRGIPKGVIIHSDQGSVYTTYAYQHLVKDKDIVGSMSRRGNCWDNAVIESFHSNIKSEEFQYVKYNSISTRDVIYHVDKYMKFYNNERIQEKLDYQSPLEYGKLVA